METPAFIQNIGWGTFGFGGLGFGSNNYGSTSIFNGALVGLSYYDLEYVYHHIHEGTSLELRREPRNRHDYNAIAVYFRNHKIGFLPKAANELAAHLMDEGGRLKALVTKVTKKKYLPTTGLDVELIQTESIAFQHEAA